MNNLKEISNSKTAVHEFNEQDLKVANDLQPAEVVRHLDPKYKFDRKIVDLQEIHISEHSTNNTAASISSQTARAGYNPATKKIGQSIDAQEGINLSTITITLNINSKGNYTVIDGLGRYRALRDRNFTNVLAFVPKKQLERDVEQQLSQHANDHLPQGAITQSDIVDGVCKALPGGRIPGITEDLYDRYSKSTHTPEEEAQYVLAIERYVNAVSKNNHTSRAIKTMISDITRDTKNGVSDIQLFMDNSSLTGHLAQLANMGVDINPDSKVNVILPLINDGTRKPENVLGAIVKRYIKTRDQSRAEAVKLNMSESFVEPTTVNVVVGLSKWKPQSTFTKMSSLKTLYKMRGNFESFLRDLQSMIKKDNIFIGSSEIPAIGFKGFINPWKKLEKYGWNFGDLITWDSHPSFDDVIDNLCNGGLLTQDEVDKLKIN